MHSASRLCRSRHEIFAAGEARPLWYGGRARIRTEGDENEIRQAGGSRRLASHRRRIHRIGRPGNGQRTGGLALAGVVALYSPLLTADEREAVSAFFVGQSGVRYAKKISVTADKIVCRVSNVDITARSCELTFKGAKQTITGRRASEIFATEAMAGVPSDGAAGSVFESLSKLNCTLDPAEIRKKAGGGATCSFETGN